MDKKNPQRYRHLYHRISPEMQSNPDLKERRRHHENPLVGTLGSTQTRTQHNSI